MLTLFIIWLIGYIITTYGFISFLKELPGFEVFIIYLMLFQLLITWPYFFYTIELPHMIKQFKKDNCEICRGKRGGVKGNENIIDGKIMCDYCHADTLKINRT